MQIRIIAVGKLKEKYWQAACQEYSKRLGPFCRLEIKEVAEERLGDNPSQAEIEKALRKEGERIEKMLSPSWYTIPLVIAGEMLSSPELAEKIESWPVEGKSQFAFIIGGSHGLSAEIVKAGDFCLSFSPVTFPHQLMRVILLEQLYRAFTIIQGGKYHK